MEQWIAVVAEHLPQRGPKSKPCCFLFTLITCVSKLNIVIQSLQESNALVVVFVFLEKKKEIVIFYMFNNFDIINTLLFFFCILCYTFNSQQPLKNNFDVKSETNGSTLVEKKDKKVKKTQSADSVSSKETRKDRKLSRKRVCIILFKLKEQNTNILF